MKSCRTQIRPFNAHCCSISYFVTVHFTTLCEIINNFQRSLAFWSCRRLGRQFKTYSVYQSVPRDNISKFFPHLHIFDVSLWLQCRT